MCAKNITLLLTDVSYGDSLGLMRVSVMMCRPRRPDHEERRRYRLTRRNKINYEILNSISLNKTLYLQLVFTFQRNRKNK
jgi:hypothetical protein